MTQSIPPIVPMSYPDITDAERQAVMSVLETPILSIGPQVEAFEEAICHFSGSFSPVIKCNRQYLIGLSWLNKNRNFNFIANTNNVAGLQFHFLSKFWRN